MDLSDSIVPKSDQLNAEDLLTGPVTVTIDRVVPGSSEQPVNIHLVEFPGRPYRPSKTQRRVMVAAWGKDTTNYPGRRMTLYRDPKVKFGGMEVGGIKISHLSDIDAPMELALSVTRGKREVQRWEPLQSMDSQRVEPLAGAYTPDHERVIKEHMGRASIPPARVLELAKQAAGRDVKSARELSSVEADALLVVLGDLPDAEEA